MFLIVGLGNPGKEYEESRHNAGFAALDEFAKEHGFPECKLSKKTRVLISEAILGSAKVVLAKPQTFMNNSGFTVKKLIENWKLKPENCIVVHDDIDLPLGTIKISQSSGSAGHKGVESIIQALGTKNFTRVRIGILPLTGKPKNVENFVLQKFKKTELPLLKTALQETATSLSLLILANPWLSEGRIHT